jgi:hypothetical protein
VRTFYRVFPTKEDVLQVQIDRRAGTVRAGLEARPPDEAPLLSLRLGLADAASREDPAGRAAGPRSSPGTPRR